MPTAEMGTSLPFDRTGFGKFLRLKDKDQWVKFRFILSEDGKMSFGYSGSHFRQFLGEWQITPCPRVMENAECSICTQYDTIMEEVKSLRDENAKKAKQKEADEFKVKKSYYYPILDFSDHKAKILEVVESIRWKIERAIREAETEGIDALALDWKVTRTEQPGMDYYTLKPIDSARTEVLTAGDKEEISAASTWDLDGMIKKKVQPVGNWEEEA